MKFRVFSLSCYLVLCCGLCNLHAGQTVDIVKTYPSKDAAPYYHVIMDFGGADDYDSHFIIGQKYAEAILAMYHDRGGFENVASSVLRKSLNQLGRSGVKFRDMMARTTELMVRCDKEGDEYYLAGAEIEGMNSVFNSSRNGYSSRDRLWLLIFNENQLTLRELYLLNMISSGLGTKPANTKSPTSSPCRGFGVESPGS